ncbi:hypothetical protein SAMN02745136_03857 [Anaerocolumna jejuensis DSM 15929]|uniref:Uncharacterized protein n=1 Tax=Anaerocolumna jejuensis DSM 15929 TaxID=1121322 RepID=A0A1M6X2C4_9FIRM|nr:hypothetical protein [Anaerocolumna jejuensis]SHL00086.1 hypothetical protein SAMN02745136_03857 [Anaerocolumna jejuensis DSM 15929]
MELFYTYKNAKNIQKITTLSIGKQCKFSEKVVVGSILYHFYKKGKGGGEKTKINKFLYS